MSPLFLAFCLKQVFHHLAIMNKGLYLEHTNFSTAESIPYTFESKDPQLPPAIPSLVHPPLSHSNASFGSSHPLLLLPQPCS